MRFGWMIVAASGAAISPAPAWADALQNEIVGNARATRADTLAFRRTMTVEATGQAKKVVVEQFDPRRAAAERWSLVTVDGRAPTAKELGDARKAKRGPTPGYGRLAEWFGAPATRSDVGPGRVLYKFARLPAGIFKMGSHDASADVRAEALVNTSGRVPFVERVRLTSTKPFRMMLVASVKSMSVDSRYRPLADGTVVPSDNDSIIQGSMMGKSGQMRTQIDYSDFAKVR